MATPATSTPTKYPSHPADPISLRLLRLWEEGKAPNIEEFVRAAGSVASAQVVSLLDVDQWHRWQGGQRIPAEDYLRRFPQLQKNPEFGLQLVYGEFLLREQLGEQPNEDEYLRRFPQFADRFLEQLELHRAVAAMPQTHVPPESMLEAAADGKNARTPRLLDSAGECLGRFRLGALHARGGLGEVFLADDEELHRRVAFKRIRAEKANDKQLRRRFLAEAELTAKLEHPGIVPIYGLVQGPDGEPYYAMRYIEGESLAEAIQRFHGAETPASSRNRISERFTGLPFRSLVQKFISVCQTMAYAHSKNVIHRDLKPANVMLGAYGETLVVDWGLAREIALSPGAGSTEPVGADEILPAATQSTPQSSDERLYTQAGEALGTPGYMAPEQAAGRWNAVDPRSDVYSLGATLYELLTGQRPISGRDVLQVLQKAQQGDFPPPRALNPGVPKPLESICLKAMALRPENRYTDPRALAADLEHWMADEPVESYAEPWASRARRWMRRHRTWVIGGVAAAAVAAACLAVLVGVVTGKNAALTAERDRANEGLNKAHEAVETFFNRIADDPKLREREFHDLRRDLLKAGLPFYEWLKRQQADAPTARAAVGLAIFRLGFIRQEMGETAQAVTEHEQMRDVFQRLAMESPSVAEYRHNLLLSLNNLGKLYGDLGKHDEAEKSLRLALSLGESATVDFPRDGGCRRQLARTCNGLTVRLHDQGKIVDAEMICRRGLIMAQELVRSQPNDNEYCAELAQAENCLGRLLVVREQRDEAEKAFRRAATLWEKLVAADAAEAAYRKHLADSEHNLSLICLETGKVADAQDWGHKALTLREKLATDFPSVPDYRDDLAVSFQMMGSLPPSLSNLGDAESYCRKCLEVRDRLVGDFPTVAAYRAKLADAHFALAHLLAAQGKRSEGVAGHRQSLAIREKLAAEFPSVPLHQQHLADSYDALGALLEKTGKLDESEAVYRRALAIRTWLAEGFPDTPAYRLAVAETCNNLGMLLVHDGRDSEGEKSYRQALEMQEKLVADNSSVPAYGVVLSRIYNNLGVVLGKLRKPADSEAAYRKAMSIQERLSRDFPAVPEYRTDLAGSYVNFGRLLRDAGQPDASLLWFPKAMALLNPIVAGDQALAIDKLFLRNAHLSQAEALDMLGRHAEAVLDWERALQLDGGSSNRSYLTVRRLLSLAASGDHAKAVGEAAEIATDQKAPPPLVFAMARVYAVASAGAKDTSLRDQYAARAVELLSQAVSKGYKDFDRISQHDDFKPLREREDYKKLLSKLAPE